jgi:hypothetical protein
MKLDDPFGELWARVDQMGAKRTQIELGVVWDESEIEFDRELSTGGIDVSLEDLESEEGLLSVRGRQVILFIPDHSFKIESAMDDPGRGNKFHIADCKTLETMRERKRFERYKVTNNLSGKFPIYGKADGSGADMSADVELNVCKNCLNMLNYHGAKNGTVADRNEVVEGFKIEEFFSTYSSVFKILPRELIEQAKKGYSRDWKEISLRRRSEAGYICQGCNVNLESKKSLLHVHHINGEKSDNSSVNLVVLCADCHRKEPYHGHMCVSLKHVQSINHLRREQGIVDAEDTWAQVFRYADPALRGVMDHCQRRRMPVPKIAYPVHDQSQKIVAELNLAWPGRKEAIYLGEKPKIDGWSLFSLKEAMDQYS